MLPQKRKEKHNINQYDEAPVSWKIDEGFITNQKWRDKKCSDCVAACLLGAAN